MRHLTVPLALSLALTAPVLAQSTQATGSVTFDYFSDAALTVSDTYTFDNAFSEQYGVEVPVPFRIDVPRRDEVGVQTALMPEGGAFMGYTFFIPGPDGSPAVFLENLQFTNATIPVMADQPDPDAARAQAMAGLLENEVFPAVSAGFERPEILTLELAPNPPVPGAVHMVARMYDAQYDDTMLVRAMILPHPDQAESLLAVSMINLDEVAANDLETLLATLSGRVLASFEYLAE
ncbi:hypothetical protein HKCCE4037_03670 [Rhodobacterales bacterium HKCCE4037]|nr:hypothetical protein [Rhodobacterales bacterium HKCCE4037]